MTIKKMITQDEMPQCLDSPSLYDKSVRRVSVLIFRGFKGELIPVSCITVCSIQLASLTLGVQG